jgi:hypothetical protein
MDFRQIFQGKKKHPGHLSIVERLPGLTDIKNNIKT